MTKKDQPPPATLGTQLSILRSMHGWSQARAAEACGVYQQTYQGWESDKVAPQLPGLMAIARGFGVSLTVTADGAKIAPGKKVSD